MSEPRYEGPRIGDRVQVEAWGTVREMQGRDGMPGVLVELDSAAQVWGAPRRCGAVGARFGRVTDCE